MFSPSKNNSPLSSSFEEPVYHNHRNIRNMQTKYFSDEYMKSMQAKAERQKQQQARKRQQLQFYKQKNSEYLSSLASNRQNKLQQKQLMAEQYQEMINARKMREQVEKQIQRSLEKDMLSQKTWIRDVGQERETSKMKSNRYNQQLEMHVRLQEQRIRQEQEKEREMREKISLQAQQILNKEVLELQERQRRKQLFEQRQNQLLGISGQRSKSPQAESNSSTMYSPITTSLTNSRVLEQNQMKRKQQELYGLGLEAQRQTQEQRKKKEVEQHYMPGLVYNPITNPIPIVYKNPNVIRMLSQK